MEIKEIVFSSKEAEKNKEYYEKLVVQTIEESERSGIEIGNGKAANVLSLKQDERLCMKAIYNKDISRNDTHKEMEIMQNLYSKGVRVPKPICSIKTTEKDYIFMEKIGDGISIEDIIYDNSGELLKKLPTNFNFNKFFEILRQEVAKMHNERKYHRDLHAGNVLIDENGEPVIIDFGDSKDLILSDDDPYREVNKRVEEIVYPNDDDNVNKLRANFGRYLAKFNFFK